MNKIEESPAVQAVYGELGQFITCSSYDLVGELDSRHAELCAEDLRQEFYRQGYGKRAADTLIIIGIAVVRNHKWELAQDRLMEEGDFETEI